MASFLCITGPATLLGDTVVSLVVYGVGGAVIAMVLNRGAAEA